jgi:hypothetical protein
MSEVQSSYSSPASREVAIMGGQRVFAALVATYPWVPASKHQAIGDATAPGAPRRHSEPATTQQDGAVAATRPNKKVASDAQVEGEPIAIVKPDVDTLDLDQRTERTLPLSGMATEPAQLQLTPVIPAGRVSVTVGASAAAIGSAPLFVTVSE